MNPLLLTFILSCISEANKYVQSVSQFALYRDRDTTPSLSAESVMPTFEFHLNQRKYVISAGRKLVP